MSTYRTLMPVLGRVLVPHCFVGMSYSASIATSITSGVAGIIVDVVAYVFFVSTDRALMPVLGRVLVPGSFVGVGY